MSFKLFQLILILFASVVIVGSLAYVRRARFSSLTIKDRKVLRSVFIFFTSYCTIFLIGYIFSSYLPYLKEITVQGVCYILNLFSLTSYIIDDNIQVSYMVITVIPYCTCFYEITLFSSLLLSLDSIQTRRKIEFIFIAIPILFVFSCVRIASIIMIGLRYGVGWLEIFHIYVWSISVVLFPALLLWIMVKLRERV